jgi:hypothetical protein
MDEAAWAPSVERAPGTTVSQVAEALLGDASQGAVINPEAGSPNRPLYTTVGIPF